VVDVTDAERERLRAELSIPDGVKLHVTDSGEAFVGGRFVWCGIPRDGGVLSPLGGAFVDGQAIQVRLQRLMLDGIRTFLEWRWQPGQDLSIAIVCPDEDASDNEIAFVWSHRRPFWAASRGTDGPIPLGRARLVRDFAEAMAAVAKREEIPLERVSWAAIGRQMHIGDDGVRYRRTLAKGAVPRIEKHEVVAAASCLRFSRGDT